MDSKDKQHYNNWKRFVNSFVYAWSGLKHVITHEQNMRIHLFFSVIVIGLAFVLSISTIEKVILLIVIGIILSLEILNTAIERAVDLITTEYHPLAKIIKDVSASAVLLFSFIAVIIGIIIFYDPLIQIIIK